MTRTTFDSFISYAHADCGDIAPAIQKGIQHIGRPWYRVQRMISVFRDETNLTASPHLWPNIETALLNSDYFILFASPIAASSAWVSKEINVWINKNYSNEAGLQKIIIVLTDGKIVWDPDTEDFNWELTNCLPREALKGRFKGEPFWIDLTPYVRSTEQGKVIDYKSAGFTLAMTKIIGAIRGVEPWKIESAELKRIRNTRRFLASVCFILLSLFFLAGIFFFRERRARLAEQKANAVIIAQSDSIKNELARTYWNQSKTLKSENDFLSSLFYGVESMGYTSDTSLRTTILQGSASVMPLVQLEAVIPAGFNSYDCQYELSPDGSKLLVAKRAEFEDNFLRVFDVKRNKELVKPIKLDHIWSARFSPDGSKILVHVKHNILLFDAGNPGRQPLAIDSALGYMAEYSEDGTRLLVEAWRDTIHVLNAATLQKLYDSVHTRVPYQDPYSKLPHYLDSLLEDNGSFGRGTFFSDSTGRLGVFVCNDGKARVYDMKTWIAIGPPIRDNNPFNVFRSGSFSRDNKMFALATQYGIVNFYDVQTHALLGTIKRNIDHIAFAADNMHMATTGRNEDSSITIWRFVTRDKANNDSGYLKGTAIIYAATLSPDHSRMVVLDRVEEQPFTSLKVFGLEKNKTFLIDSVKTKDEELFLSAAFSPDGKKIIAAVGDKTRTYDAKTLKELPSLRYRQQNGKDDGIASAEYSPDGKQIVSVHSADLKMKLGVWDPVTLEQRTAFDLDVKPEFIFIRAIYNSRGNLLAVYSGGSDVIFVDPQNAKQIGVPLKHSARVTSAVFTSNDEQIITTTEDGFLYRWNIKLRQLVTPPVQINKLACAISGSGNRCMILSTDGKIRWLNNEGDLDMDPELFKLQVQAQTGLRFTVSTGQTDVLRLAEWENIKKEYEEKTRQHYQICRYRDQSAGK